MNLKNQTIEGFFFRYWWLYYLLFFIFLGILIYSLKLDSSKVNERRINRLSNQLDSCYQEKLLNDSVRVVNNAGRFECLSFTLIWNSSDDLDLSVIDARKDLIFFKRYCKSFDNRFSSAGGQLDIDLNAGDEIADQPVENIYFKCTPPKGIYEVRIHAYKKREPMPVRFSLIVRERGQVVKEISSTISQQNELITLLNYNYVER
jgi:hypothetical protein